MGYLQYAYAGRGITKTGKNLFLTTGTYTHKGMEALARWFQKNKGKLGIPVDLVNNIVDVCKLAYFKEVFEEGEGFDLSEETLDEWSGEPRILTPEEMRQRQQYCFNEQAALVEAFIRLAATRIFPRWLQQYRIVSVEQDMSFPFAKGEGFEVIQSARIDLVLQEIETKDLYLINFKSFKSFDKRTAKAASHDTQGLSESWAFDEYLRSKGIDKRVMGVKMLYFVKGLRKETKRGSGDFYQDSPLIRGWRRLGEEGPEYAYSWFFPNPKNDSGVGALGRSWDRFDVFQDDFSQEVGGVKGWIDRLERGEIQPELEGTEFGDVIGRQMVEPLPYGRFERDLESWERQAKAREYEIAEKLVNLADAEKYWQEAKWDDGDRWKFVDENFPQNLRACHYPTDCPYLDICHGTEEQRNNPLEGGFEFRTPHHKAELVQLKGAQ